MALKKTVNTPHGFNAVDADRTLAQVAFDSLGQTGGLMMVVGDDAMAAIASMGLELVPVEGEII